MGRSPKGTIGVLLLSFGVATTAMTTLWAYRAFGGADVVNFVTGVGLIDAAMILYLTVMFAVGLATLLLGLLLVTARFG